MEVTAKAERSGSWWAVEVPEIPGLFTQARRLDLVPAMVVEAASLLDVDLELADVTVEPHLSSEDADAIASARHASNTPVATRRSHRGSAAKRSPVCVVKGCPCVTSPSLCT